MMQDPTTSELFDTFAEDLLAEQKARPLIIVGASKVDHLLLEVVRHFLLPKIAKAKDQDELLEGDAPLATFSARIKMCRRLGLIDETLYLTLEHLRALRNLGAHALLFDVTKSPAREHLAEVRKRIAHRDSYCLTKQRFFEAAPLHSTEELQCLLLTVCVLLEAIREKVIPTGGNKSALSIAAK
ncbi:MAG: hypothetical protein MUP47_02280 [Phycisphaerae bacterium]|nr:hypothetical protein [Phycisphaerae bacterium]